MGRRRSRRGSRRGRRRRAREQAREEEEGEQAREEKEKKELKEEVEGEEGEEKSEKRKGEEDGPLTGLAGVSVSVRVCFGVSLFHHVGEVGVRQGLHQACPSGTRVSRSREEQVE